MKMMSLGMAEIAYSPGVWHHIGVEAAPLFMKMEDRAAHPARPSALRVNGTEVICERRPTDWATQLSRWRRSDVRVAESII
jgi:hypothetical protein